MEIEKLKVSAGSDRDDDAHSAADKLGSAGPYVVAPLEELTHLVTDRACAPQDLEPYRARGVEVVLA